MPKDLIGLNKTLYIFEKKKNRRRLSNLFNLLHLSYHVVHY